MDDPRLKELLRRADARGDTEAAPVDAAGIAGTVLRRRTRRTRARAGLAVALLAIAAGGLWQVATRQPAAAPAPQLVRAPAVPDQATADQLERESAAWLAIARRAEAAERLGRARADAALGRAAVQSERERAATVMVRQGDWRRQRGLSGTEEYRRAAQLFAGTRAAAEARARLGQG